MKVYIEIIKNFVDKKYYKKIVFLFIFTFFNLALEIFSIGLIIPIVGLLLNPEFLNEYLFFKNFLIIINPLKYFFNLNVVSNLLGGLCLTFFILILIKNLILFLIMNYKTMFIYEINLDIRSNFLSKIIDLPYLTVSKYKISGLMTYSNNTTVIGQVLEILLQTSIELILIFGIMIFLFINSPEAMMMILFIPIILFFINKLLLNSKLSFYSNEIRVNEKEQVNFLLGILSGMKTIILNDVKPYFLKYFNLHQKKSEIANFKFQIYSGSIRFFLEVMVAGVIVSILIFFTLKGTNTQAIITTLAIFLASAIKIMPSLNKITNTYQTLKYDQERMIDLNNFYKQNFKNIENINRVNFNKFIKLNNYSFSYERNNSVIEDSNLEISAGQKILITGSSGSGKTTLMNIISGIIQSDNGKYILDSIEMNSRFKILNLGYVTQKSFFMPDTILNNICFGQLPQNQEKDKVVECLKDSELYDYIQSLPLGLDTKLAHEGEGFSGGQLQRLALARILYKNSDLIILDEFSNALDTDNENKIFNTLFSKYKKKTILIISHKKYDKFSFDKKFSIVNKKIIET